MALLWSPFAIITKNVTNLFMFIKIANDGTYMGSSARSTEGYFPVSHELSKSLRARVIKSTANVRRSIGTQPAPVIVGADELWEDIKDDPYSLVETYVYLYCQREKIDPSVVTFVGPLLSDLTRNVDKILKYFVDSDKIPSNLFELVVSLANGDEIVDALYEEIPKQSTEKILEDDKTPAFPEQDTFEDRVVVDEGSSDGKRSKGKRAKGRNEPSSKSDSPEDIIRDGQTQQASESSD